MKEPLFANALSIKNTLDRARMRQANLLCKTSEAQLTKANLAMIKDKFVEVVYLLKIDFRIKQIMGEK